LPATTFLVPLTDHLIGSEGGGFVQYGYTQDFPVEQRLRDVIGQQIADGTPQIQKLIVARRLFGRDG
jgi:hypothetical protein